MSTFRAFQTGLEAGQRQAKVKREDDARIKAAEAFGSGNYEGAVSSLMGVGLMQDADAYGQAGERKKEAERTEAYASAFKTGLGAGPAPDRKAGYQAVGQAAGQRGDFATMANIDQALAQMDEGQAAQFADGMEFLGSTALSLKQVPPEARGQAAVEILKNSPYGNPQVLAQIQQAAADGRITDEELDAFAMQTMSVADRVKLEAQNKPEPFTLSPGQVRYGPDGTELVRGPAKPPSNGIDLQFNEDGTVSGLTIGGTGQKGKEPAIVRGPNGQPVVSPGQQQLLSNKSWNALQTAAAKTGLVRQEIARALPLVKGGTTGAWAAMKDFPLIGPSTESGRLAQLLKTVKGNVGFDELQTMRENSPTGGALGQVAIQELEMLQAILGSLEQAQTEQDLTFNLKRLDNYMANRDERRREAFAMDYPELAEFAGFAKRTKDEIKRIASDADFDALPSGAEFIGPDGVKRRKP